QPGIENRNQDDAHHQSHSDSDAWRERDHEAQQTSHYREIEWRGCASHEDRERHFVTRNLNTEGSNQAGDDKQEKGNQRYENQPNEEALMAVGEGTLFPSETRLLSQRINSRSSPPQNRLPVTG